MLSDRYVVVNIPAASIEAVEGGIVAQRHTAVVGRIDRPTPILNSKIQQINFNPYWHVPKSIIQKDLIKYMNEDPEYLTKFKIHIYDGKGNELLPTDIDWTHRRGRELHLPPGARRRELDGALQDQLPQQVRRLPARHAVEVACSARTPASIRRAACASRVSTSWSTGCSDNGGWDQGAVDAVFDSNERLDVSLKQPMPIHTTYITAWANRQGTVSFRDDVYEFDAQGKVDVRRGLMVAGADRSQRPRRSAFRIHARSAARCVSPPSMQPPASKSWSSPR